MNRMIRRHYTIFRIRICLAQHWHFIDNSKMEWIEQWGYIGLFVVCFLSSSIVPMTSEFFLIGMQQLDFNVWNILAVASVGNYLGSMTTYWIGRSSSDYLFNRFQPTPQRRAQAERLYAKWGGPILFFSWIPFIGDALTFVSGVLRGNVWVFTFWVALGKWVRFAAVLGGFQLIKNWL